MKKIIASLGFAVAILSLAATSSFAQATASASSSATIVTPISISKTADMNFGNVAVSSTAGTVVLAPAGTRTSTGGISLPATAGTVAAAAFTVTGQGAYTYAITLPSSALTITDGGTNSMTVSNFTSTPSSTGTLSSGTQSVEVGATLNVGGSQAAGSYTSATPFDVTVNYN
jgi:hypothetical protein